MIRSLFAAFLALALSGCESWTLTVGPPVGSSSRSDFDAGIIAESTAVDAALAAATGFAQPIAPPRLRGRVCR